MKKIIFSAKRIDLLIVLISSLMMILVLNLPFKAHPFGDKDSFFDEAKLVSFFLKDEVGYDQVTLTKAPAPVFIYAPTFLLTSAHPTDMDLWYRGVAINFVLATISLLMIYRAARNFFDEKTALISVMLLFLFPIHFYYIFGITAEVPAFFAASVIAFGWSRVYFNSRKLSNWLLFGFGLWLLIMCRPNALLILGLGFLALVYAFFKRKDFFREYGKKTFFTLTVCGLACFATLQLAKLVSANKKAYDQEGLFYFVAHQGRYQFREEPLDFRFWDDDVRPDSKDYKNWKLKAQELEETRIRTGKTSPEVYRDYLINDILGHPFITTRQFFVKSLFGHIYIVNSISPQSFHLGPLKGPFFYWAFLFVVNLINVLIIAGSFIFLFKTKDLLKYWPIWSITLGLLFFHGMMYMEPRYMLPSRIALHLMGAAGLYQIGWIRKKIDFVAKFVFPVKNRPVGA
ncbi:MAG: glycosyltransferase family 39 protein [Flavobacterium sp.]